MTGIFMLLSDLFILRSISDRNRKIIISLVISQKTMGNIMTLWCSTLAKFIYCVILISNDCVFTNSSLTARLSSKKNTFQASGPYTSVKTHGLNI